MVDGLGTSQQDDPQGNSNPGSNNPGQPDDMNEHYEEGHKGGSASQNNSSEDKKNENSSDVDMNDNKKAM